MGPKKRFGSLESGSPKAGGGPLRSFGRRDASRSPSPVEFQISSPTCGDLQPLPSGASGANTIELPAAFGALPRNDTTPPQRSDSVPGYRPKPDEGQKASSPKTPSPPSVPPPQATQHPSGNTLDKNNDEDDDGPLSQVRCPVCLDPFSSPVTLQCNHNVCEHHIADLAAAAGSRATPTDKFEVPCPKCRQVSVFEGLQSVRVNHEMKMLVDMVATLYSEKLKQQRASKSTEGQDPSPAPSAPNTQSTPIKDVPGSSPAAYNANVTPLPSAMKKKRVDFMEPGKEPQRQQALPLAPSGSNSVGLLPSATRDQRPSSGDGSSPSSGPKSIASVEAELQEAREKSRNQRAKEQQAKQDAFKRQRMMEIEKRRQLMLHQAEQIMGEDGTSAVVQQGAGMVADVLGHGPIGSEDQFQVLEQEFDRLRHQRERAKEAERVRREEAVRDQVTSWMNKGGAEASLKEDLRASEKARRMEEQLMPMYVPPEQRPKPTQEELDEMMRPEPEQYDFEVERKMFEVDQLMEREREEELSNAQKAELAEARARAMLGKLKGKPKELKPTYIPKLHRRVSMS